MQEKLCPQSGCQPCGGKDTFQFKTATKQPQRAICLERGLPFAAGLQVCDPLIPGGGSRKSRDSLKALLENISRTVGPGFEEQPVLLRSSKGLRFQRGRSHAYSPFFDKSDPLFARKHRFLPAIAGFAGWAFASLEV